MVLFFNLAVLQYKAKRVVSRITAFFTKIIHYIQLIVINVLIMFIEICLKRVNTIKAYVSPLTSSYSIIKFYVSKYRQ